MAVVQSLHIYPVKSCRGIALQETMVTERGLPHDREWMLVDENRLFMTQRSLPRMALIETALTGSSLLLQAPGRGRPLAIPLATPPERPRLRVQVWRDVCTATDEGNDAAEWLSAFLDQPCRLVRFAPDQRRLSPHEWTQGLDAENRFSDAYPILVISEESLEGLNDRLDEPLPMDRFRPNLVIRGLGAHGEDEVGGLFADDVKLRMVKPCVRCRITTTDQQTAEVGKEPLRTLATYRRDTQLNGVTFGMNAIMVPGAGGSLRVGQELSVG